MRRPPEPPRASYNTTPPVTDKTRGRRQHFSPLFDVSAESSPEIAAALFFRNLLHLDLHGPAAVCLPALLRNTGQQHIMDHINI